MEKGYICWCRKSFQSSVDLKLHEKAHLKENKVFETLNSVQCFKNVDMDTKYTLLNRIQDSYEDMKSCTENSVEFKNMDYRYEYICEEDPLACTSKSEPEYISEKSEGELENREETTHKKHPFVCNVCSCKFWKKKFFVRHTLKHKKILSKKDYREVVTTNVIRKTGNSRNCISRERTKKVLSVCLSSNKTTRRSPYPQRDTDDSYPLMYDTRGGFQCSYCPYNSIRRKDTEVHQKRVHSGDTPFICDICPCSVNSSRAFKYHVTHFHPELIKDGVIKEHAAFHQPSTVVESTTQSRSDKSNVTRKRKTEHNNLSCCRFSPFKCKDDHFEAKNRPKSKPKPKPVIIVATKRDPKKEVIEKKRKVVIVYADELTCSYCPLSFTTASGKRRHEWIHTGVMPYSCVHCGASFRKSETYKKHQQACQSTSSSLASKSDSFPCAHCNATYKTKIMLTRHENKAHRTVSKPRNLPKKIVSFPCDVCDASFKIQSMVDAHKRRAHKKKQQVERKKNLNVEIKVPHFVNCVEETVGLLKKEIELPELNVYEEIKNIAIADNTPEINHFYEISEQEDFPIADHPHLQSEPVQEYIPEMNNLHKRSECVQEFPITDDVPAVNDSSGIPRQVQEFPVTETVPDVNSMQESFTIKQELVESPEHCVIHDKHLWSEFIVIDDDD